MPLFGCGRREYLKIPLMDTSATPAAPPPSSVLFARGVIARLATWDTLHLAIQEGWGGPGALQKRTWLASVIVDAFEETVPTPDDQYVEEILLQVLADEFDTDLEDGSAESVALDMVRLWDETRVGQDDLVRKLEAKAESVRGKRAVAQQAASGNAEEWEEEDDEDDSGMDEDEGEVPPLMEFRPREEPEIDEDGFTMVKGKGKNHR
ncbi:Pre-rRNA-processing protein TSR2-domain-containing protein [Mycena metata]|uniref:Pre-rRNA-processing protein TSR2-domain-containing protein n=1 Tax=Mycena metata TaxID=1033252 RepID=A0AAD7I030_9AGAR|nr:Pre-rRNA-processing protein TSR2-domain-containing protein [Mycena metata]